ncbi:holotricin-3-like isoform X2 [Dioscorea cayenensis subsp. rotundata]|uniref:Holotricin-3-like isoform X2 n=1 Tax=Dioscorea cayennensis subsp. rotundata TaxID=55577 RepID=A0AB40AYS6_DIOCR|nr:holotricin-3-like isoform X2 [Dioscorea cayenensis subsp. rotundata]
MAASKSLFVLIGLLGIILLLSFEVVSARELAQQTEKANKEIYEEKNTYGGQGWLPGSGSGYGYGYQPGGGYFGGYQPGFGLGGPYFGGIPQGGYYGGHP